MTDEEFDSLIEQLEANAEAFARRKPVIVSLLSYASSRRAQSQGEDKTEWRRETNRLDLLREASNLIDKALAK